jgi:hypothetical protein
MTIFHHDDTLTHWLLEVCRYLEETGMPAAKSLLGFQIHQA